MPATFLVVPMRKKEMEQGLWGSPQHWVRFGCSCFKFKAFYMAAEWETFQNLQEAGKESSITKSILTETEELANKHMWNVPLFVTTRGTVFPTNTLSIWWRTATTCLCGYDPCCPAKGRFKQAIPLPYTWPSSYSVIFSVLLLFCNRWYFSEIPDLQNDSNVMQMGSFAEIKIHHEHSFTDWALYFSLNSLQQFLSCQIPFCLDPALTFRLHFLWLWFGWSLYSLFLLNPSTFFCCTLFLLLKLLIVFL